MAQSPAVLIASGGLDSTVLAYDLARRGQLRALFFVNYGQASVHAQVRFVRYHAERLGVRLHIDRMKLPKYMQGSGHIISGQPLRDHKLGDQPLDAECWDDHMRLVWDDIPARNTIFLLRAAAYASKVRRLNRVVVGFQCEPDFWEVLDEGRSTPGIDSTPRYLAALNQLVAAGGMLDSVRFDAPYLERRLSSAQIARRGKRLGVNINATYSCEFSPVCGTCVGCLKRKTLGLPSPDAPPCR